MIVLFLLTAFSVDVPTALLIASAFLIGKIIAYYLGGDDKKKTFSLYGVLFLIGWGYMIMCYWYMVGHGYDWLFAFDTYHAYIPFSQNYVNQADGNLWDTYKLIFENYTFFSRKWYFSFVYFCTWIIIINDISGTLYLGLQTSTLFIFGFVGVMLYKLFLSYGFGKEKGIKHTLIICSFSIIFFYSSQILRDIHVLLCFLIAFYLSSKQRFSIITLFELIIVIFICCGIRIESGLFLLLSLPVYLLLSIQEKKHRFYAVFGSIAIIITLAVFIIANFQMLSLIIKANSDSYLSSDKGAGMISLFQSIPVFGKFISIFYNASQPMPFWSRLFPFKDLQYGGNASNIMNFTRIPAAFFNIMTYVYIIVWLFNRDIRVKINNKITQAHKYQLWIGLAFLYIQSAVISQRRLMGYYCIFYILMFVIYDNVSLKERKSLNAITMFIFLFLQIIGIVY